MVDVRQVQQVHERSVQSFNAALSEEHANYQRAAAVGDVDEMSRAAGAMAGLRATKKELDLMAYEAVTPPAPPPMAGSDEMSKRDVDLARHYQIDATTLSIAKNWTSDPNMSDEQKVRGYLEQRQRYHRMRQSGEYRDDQGKVTR